jgi:hypothetical protein
MMFEHFLTGFTGITVPRGSPASTRSSPAALDLGSILSSSSGRGMFEPGDLVEADAADGLAHDLIRVGEPGESLPIVQQKGNFSAGRRRVRGPIMMSSFVTAHLIMLFLTG